MNLLELIQLRWDLINLLVEPFRIDSTPTRYITSPNWIFRIDSTPRFDSSPSWIFQNRFNCKQIWFISSFRIDSTPTGIDTHLELPWKIGFPFQIYKRLSEHIIQIQETSSRVQCIPISKATSFIWMWEVFVSQTYLYLRIFQTWCRVLGGKSLYWILCGNKSRLALVGINCYHIHHKEFGIKLCHLTSPCRIRGDLTHRRCEVNHIFH